MSLARDESGIAGFYEDIPVLIVVTIGISIFLLSMIHSYGIYAEYKESTALYDECFDLSRSIRSYDAILVNGSYTGEPTVGRFDANKLSTVEFDLHTEHNYSVSIVDIESGTEWNYGDVIPSDTMIKKVVTTSVAIQMDANTVHLGKLIVTVW